MWFTIGLVAGYVLGAFTWPLVRLWLMKMREHPIDTIERDIAALHEKLKRLKGEGSSSNNNSNAPPPPVN